MARILVVDDDHGLRDLLAATLDFGEHDVTCAADGETALELCKAAPPDVVVLDLDLPGLDGAGVLAALRASGCAARVVVLTASGRGREAALRAAGASAYLTKPFAPLALLAAIEAAGP